MKKPYLPRKRKTVPDGLVFKTGLQTQFGVSPLLTVLRTIQKHELSRDIYRKK